MEEWKIIPDTEGVYSISKEAVMRNNLTGKTFKGHLKKSTGYIETCLRTPNSKRNRTVHRIMGELDSEVEDFVRGKTDIISQRVYGDHDDPASCTLKVISYEEQLDNIWRDFHHKREQFFKLFLEEDA